MSAEESEPNRAPRFLPDVPQPGDRVGQFELIRELGVGGMGIVYLARDVRLGRLVALKFLLAAQAVDLGHRFMAEARMTARFNHENIVTLHDVGEHRGHLYMALEYVRGQSLRQWLDARAPSLEKSSDLLDSVHEALAVPQVLDIMVPVVRALLYAHDMGLVHRDIKPENIMITESSTVKVLDFGIARPSNHFQETKQRLDTNDVIVNDTFQAHETHGTSGTRPYMAPEQLRGKDIDGQSDIWAVGIVLAELATGQHPMQQSILKHADVDTPLPKMAEAHPHLDLGPLSGIIDRCLIKDKAHRTPSAQVLLEELEGLINPRTKSAILRDEGPFAGLSSFQESDADRFFGREREVQRLVGQLRTQPWLALVGASGAGKSSLVRAGIVPALKRSGEGWDVMIFRPGRSPLLALAEGIAHLSTSQRLSTSELPQELSSRFQEEPGAFGMHLRQHCRVTGRRLLVFVDQFEELYTLGASNEVRVAFGHCLEGAADDATSPLRVIVTLRSDFIHRTIEDGGFVANFLRHLVLVKPLQKDSLEAALIEPLGAYGYRFESSRMLDMMLEDLSDVSGVLPLLQFTASRLWALRDESRRILTEQSYHDLGGVAGALAAHADAVLNVMPQAHRKWARTLFLQLVTLERTRALVAIDELPPGEEARSVLNRLIDARLLAVTQGPNASGMVELVHESLIHNWSRLKGWLEAERDELRFWIEAKEAADLWAKRGRPAEEVWTRGTLADARRMLESSTSSVPSLVREFIEAGQALERRRVIRRRFFITAAFVLSLFLSLVLFIQRKQALEDRNLAQTHQGLALREAATAAWERKSFLEARAKLRQSFEIEDTHVGRILWWKLRTEPIQWQRAQEMGAIHRVAFSPNGKYLAALLLTGNVRLYDPLTAEFRVLRSQIGLESMAFSSDGRFLFTGDKKGYLTGWNYERLARVHRFQAHETEVSAVSLSRDGERILTCGLAGDLKFWSIVEQRVLASTKLPGVACEAAALHPTRDLAVAASTEGTMYVWSIGEALTEIQAHADTIRQLSFTSDGRFLVTTGRDELLKKWRVSDWALAGQVALDTGPRALPVARDDERFLAWSWDALVVVSLEKMEIMGRFPVDGIVPAGMSLDGRYVAAASEGMLKLWDVDRAPPPPRPLAHRNAVNRIRFSPDGMHLFTVGADGTVRRWNVETGAVDRVFGRFEEDPAWGLDIRSGGQELVWSLGSKVEIIHLAQDKRRRLLDHGALDVQYSPDGQYVAVGRRSAVELYDADSGKLLRTFEGFDKSVQVMGLAFSSDGHYLAAGAYGGFGLVWAVDGGQPLARFKNSSQKRIVGLRFVPGRSEVLLSGWDGVVTRWDWQNDRQEDISRVPGATYWLETSHDGRTAAIPHVNGIRILDLESNVFVQDIVSSANIKSVAYSPDDRWLARTSDDATVQVYDTRTWQPRWRTSAFLPSQKKIVTHRVGSICRPMDSSRRVILLG